MYAWCAGKTVRSLRTRAIPERLRGVITTMRYTNPRLPSLSLPLPYQFPGVCPLPYQFPGVCHFFKVKIVYNNVGDSPRLSVFGCFGELQQRNVREPACTQIVYLLPSQLPS